MAHAQAKGWAYTRTPDALGEHEVLGAEATGKPVARVGTPRLRVVRTPKGSIGVVLVSPDVPFYCPVRCTARLKFDDAESIEYEAQPLPNSRYRVLSLDPAQGVIEYLRSAHRTRAQVSLFEAGVAIFDFSPGPLDWPE